jgi:glycosyltransferase involved in cell wall biosynthesis
MKMSVIIPCYNAAETIGMQLEALQQQEWRESWEVIVSDNGSTDSSMNVVERFKGKLPGLRIVDASGRRGASHARNRGAAVASGESLVFVDADDVVAPGWLQAISKAMSVHDFVASRMDFENLNSPALAKHMRTHPQRTGLQKLWYPPYMNTAGSCGLGVKRALHEAVKGYDETFLRVMDIDYCLRIQSQGVCLEFVPDALIHIRSRGTDGSSFRQVYLWGEYNTLIYKRHRPVGSTELWRWKNHFRGWVQTLRDVPRIRSAQGRTEWLQRAGWQAGILKGSIKHMVPPIPLP